GCWLAIRRHTDMIQLAVRAWQHRAIAGATTRPGGTSSTIDSAGASAARAAANSARQPGSGAPARLPLQIDDSCLLVGASLPGLNDLSPLRLCIDPPRLVI